MTQPSDTFDSALPPEPLGDDLRSQFALDQQVAFLNHGSFGARPHCVLQAQDRWRRQMEADPVEFLDRAGPLLLDHLKDVTGRFLGAEPGDFGFLTSATEAINAVLRSLDFGPGDELLTTDHAYPGIRNSLQYVARRSGATLVEVPVPLPLASHDTVVAAIEEALTPRTRLVLVDHITSFTALLFPLERIIDVCRKRGVEVLADGAHAPGMIDLSVERLAATYYAANLHKWVCAPISAAVLWVTSDNQQRIHPLVISNFLGEGFEREFLWQATRDVTSWLAAEEAIAFGERLGWEMIRRHNHEMAVWVQQMLCESWQAEPNSPLDGSMLGSMVSITLPEAVRRQFDDHRALGAHLYQAHRIEVPVTEWNGRWLIRPCCHIYNRPEEYLRLAETINELMH
ncbi:MAG: aminotransferase class V-fold PLP-dependent enzyme [Phycisphaerales bacterium]|nr:MAG: aminotransferase class V-fold PLP-dependent enzyme [Phycisphaerales bacterium]